MLTDVPRPRRGSETIDAVTDAVTRQNQAACDQLAARGLPVRPATDEPGSRTWPKILAVAA
jgi:hypothetical protein